MSVNMVLYIRKLRIYFGGYHGCSGSLEERLKENFPDIYREISVIAMLRLVTGCKGKRIKREFEASYLNDIHPDLACSDYTVRNLIQKLGSRAGEMASFMRLYMKPGSKLMFDGTSIFTRAKGEKR